MIEPGIKLTKDHIEKISKSRKGQIVGGAVPGVNKGKPSPTKGKKLPRRICEICKKDVAINIYHQYHSIKCKKTQ